MFYLFEKPFWGRGFRPFFLLGALYAAVMILAWVFIFHGAVRTPQLWNNPILWHAHEMIYGFTMAIIAGFLLTAIANWTGGAPVRHMHLAVLALLWTAGRIAFWCPHIPPLALAVIDLSFIPLLAINLSIPLLRAKNNHNLIFLGMLSLLFLGNLHMHLAAAGKAGGDPRITAYAAVLLMIMIISIVGSRIIPSFTVAGLRREGKARYQTDQKKTDIAALLLLATLGVAVLATGLESYFTGILALCAAVIHLWRMRFWHTLETGKQPLLWILHAGHLWLVAGLLTIGLHGVGLVASASLGLHMLTVGGIGSMTIGMMARVALGHTGRPIEASPLTVWSFWMMQASALLRSLAILIGGVHYSLWIIASGLFWTAAFAIYLLIYAPILWRPRPDGLEA